MHDIGDRAKLVLEAQKGSGAHLRDGFQRNLSLVIAIEGEIHDAHAAFAEAAHDTEARMCRRRDWCGARRFGRSQSMRVGEEGARILPRVEQRAQLTLELDILTADVFHERSTQLRRQFERRMEPVLQPLPLNRHARRR
jgi:hypothetical protein